MVINLFDRMPWTDLPELSTSTWLSTSPVSKRTSKPEIRTLRNMPVSTRRTADNYDFPIAMLRSNPDCARPNGDPGVRDTLDRINADDYSFVARDADVIFLLRHADRSQFADSLSAAGVKRSDSLARMLAKSGVSVAFCSDAARTRETLIPLKRTHGDALAIRSQQGRPAGSTLTYALSLRP